MYHHVKKLMFTVRVTFRDDCTSGARFGLKGRRFCEYPAVALVPRPPGVDLTMFTCARGIIEELVDQSRRRFAMRPMLKAGLPKLSSASENAFM